MHRQQNIKYDNSSEDSSSTTYRFLSVVIDEHGTVYIAHFNLAVVC